MQDMKPIDAHSIHADFLERVKEYILVNHLQPGDLLPTEAQLSDKLGVSRTVVREGLRALESVGVIYSRRGEGRYVSAFSLDPVLHALQYSLLYNEQDLRELLDIRERLEVDYIGDAIAAMDADVLCELRRLGEEIERKGEAGESFVLEDLAFHRAIYSRVDNKLLLKLLDVFWHVYGKLRDQSLYVVQDPPGQARRHVAILEAIEARNVPLAEQLIAEHFDEIRQRLHAVRLPAATRAEHTLP